MKHDITIELDGSPPDDDFVGIERSFELGLCLSPTTGSAVAAAKSLSAFIDAYTHVGVRLAGVGVDGSRVHLTLAVGLGTLEQVKTADPRARDAVVFLQGLVDEFAAYDPAFTLIPDPESAEALVAGSLQASIDADLPTLLERLEVGK